MNQWSQWFPVTSDPDPAVNAGKGVYRVRATTSPGVATPIQRAGAVDDEGIMYIGQGRVRDRIGALLDRGGHGGTHEFIDTFNHYGLCRICPREQLELQWLETPEVAEWECEWRLIEEYKRRTGDIPPGNLKH